MDAATVVLTASECAVCGCHDCTTKRRNVEHVYIRLCDDCYAGITQPAPALSHRETEGREEP